MEKNNLKYCDKFNETDLKFINKIL